MSLTNKLNPGFKSYKMILLKTLTSEKFLTCTHFFTFFIWMDYLVIQNLKFQVYKGPFVITQEQVSQSKNLVPD